MHVIGTAGHVDHGKSSLVQALTGIDPDRLLEEKKRQMTIELGFAWYESTAVGTVGIVDVPGHKDFIENMLAGVGGIDAVILVIAADEGVMPQTREHLSIISLLNVNTGLVVLTKVDMVDDSDWVDLVEADVRDFLIGSPLENAPILRVSTVTGEGISELRDALDEALMPLAARLDKGKPRLAVDRVFTMTGFGTVATGTMLDGSFRLDDEVVILPSGVKSRIRGLQSHQKRESIAFPGSRTAINLAGVDTSLVKRGNVIAAPGKYQPTRRIDAKIDVLGDAAAGLKHNQYVKVFVFTSETIGRLRLLQKQLIKPGEAGWVQIEFEDELVVVAGDRFVMRQMSPAQTIGGGVVVEPHSGTRYKLADTAIIERLERKLSPAAESGIYTYVEEHPFLTKREIQEQIPEGSSVAAEEIARFVEQGKFVKLAQSLNDEEKVITADLWQQLTRKMLEALDQFHKQFPLKNGFVSDELARKLRISKQELAVCISAWVNNRQLNESAGVLSLPSFEVRYSANQTRRIKQLYDQIQQDPFNPPGVKEAREILTDELYQSQVDQGVLIQLSGEVIIRSTEFEKMQAFVIAEISNHGLLTLAQFRDHFSTSRRVSQALLEYLDRKGITIREGDGRRLK
ncbi:MAG: selenocysteine-specific translation elongation factor [Anaerolineaceae bacterium]|nr:selenocysteine-specific translation elongation factor [Anaerolineaceae bacterium]